MNILDQILEELTEIKSTISVVNSQQIQSEIEKPLGGVSAAAKFLEVEESTIYSLIAAKKIPFHKPSKKIYFYASELNAWIKSGKGKTLEELRNEAENETLLLNKSKRA